MNATHPVGAGFGRVVDVVLFDPALAQ